VEYKLHLTNRFYGVELDLKSTSLQKPS